MREPTLITLWETPTQAIFSALQTLDIPWKDEDIATELDTAYLYNNSGNKIPSAMVWHFVDSETKHIETADAILLAKVLFALFNKRWSRLWDTMEFEYNPISNYDMVEEMVNDNRTFTYGKSRTTTNNLTHRKTGTVQNENDVTEDVNRDIYGFNSGETPVPSDADNRVTNDDNTTTYNTTDADTGTQTHADSGSDSESHRYKLTRSGNIGVTSSQDMIEQERKLWQFHFFKTVVFRDLDDCLTLKVY